MTTEVANELEQRVAASINAERVAAGLPELKVEVHLNASAQGHSDWMGETGTFSHEGEGGSTPTERIDQAEFPLEGSWQTAENIAWRTLEGELDAGEVDAMHAGLMESDGHRANILDPDAAYVGIGLSEAIVDGRDSVYLTENFANTDGQVLVQEEIDGTTVVQPYQDGDPVGEPLVPDADDDPDAPPDDPGDPVDPAEEEEEEEEAAAASAGGCFVATAAYGSYGHPDVVALRRFRDEILVLSRAGRAFIRVYRAHGPKLARFVSPAGRSGGLARAVIAPLARYARIRTARR